MEREEFSAGSGNVRREGRTWKGPVLIRSLTGGARPDAATAAIGVTGRGHQVGSPDAIRQDVPVGADPVAASCRNVADSWRQTSEEAGCVEIVAQRPEEWAR